MLTLWDIMKPVVRALRPAPGPAQPAARSRAARRPRAHPATPAGAADRYERLTRGMLSTHGIRVRRWRSGMSGMAWELAYHDGRVVRLLESPRPKGPMSAAIFLHEVGHHAIGFNRYRPRCLEEYHAWAWSLAAMRREGVLITDGVLHRVHASLHYALAKARRRGIRSAPPELAPFAERPHRGVIAAPVRAWAMSLGARAASVRLDADAAGGDA